MAILPCPAPYDPDSSTEEIEILWPYGPLTIKDFQCGVSEAVGELLSELEIGEIPSVRLTRVDW